MIKGLPFNFTKSSTNVLKVCLFAFHRVWQFLPKFFLERTEETRSSIVSSPHVIFLGRRLRRKRRNSLISAITMSEDTLSYHLYWNRKLAMLSCFWERNSLTVRLFFKSRLRSVFQLIKTLPKTNLTYTLEIPKTAGRLLFMTKAWDCFLR